MPDQLPFAFDVPTVSELTLNIKSLLEKNFRDILVEGEISNVNESRNGHYYFTVKDDNAQLPCVMWRSTAARMETSLRDGQQVVLGGDIQVYAPHGRYQMIVSLVQQAGIGKLQQKFEELKQKLEKEGLFDAAFKKPLPSYPFRVGVITSSTGAAFHDIYSTFEQRWPVANLYLHHSSVQGLNAAGELTTALSYFAAQTNPVDLIIIGRGGGSLEELWPFNEEIVARAIFECPIPVVSAVGHEVDYSISDFVADARAATPTQAVVISTPDLNELRYLIDDYTNSLENSIQQKIQHYRDYVHRLAHSHALLVVQEKLKFHSGMIQNMTRQLQNQMKQTLFEQKSKLQQIKERLEFKSPANTLTRQHQKNEQLRERLTGRFERLVHKKSDQLKQLTGALQLHNPKAPLEKGFTRVLQSNKWVRSKNKLDPKQAFLIEWEDGVMPIK
ncbi:MAG: exodeoxyribonuclease VII large subunit [Balneolaceae bacterium]|nr:exodeoxyribonuclease VII large subunit [Balneolaceae bacterium]